jgi:hypothetical protein
MRPLVIAAIIASLAVPAFAREGDPAKAEANKAEEQKKKVSDEIERAYKDALKRTACQEIRPLGKYALSNGFFIMISVGRQHLSDRTS